jgi:CheY-like chemotaxis protein
MPLDANADRALPRILIVDDEPLVLRSIVRTLSRDYEVVSASSGTEVFAALDSNPDFAAVLCDCSMPDLTGAEVYKSAVTRWPHLEGRFVLMTGSVDDFGELLSMGVPTLSKPFLPSELRAHLSVIIAAASCVVPIHLEP